jgi:hypothetical protein
MREKPKEANADETCGQDVQEESTEKFRRADRVVSHDWIVARGQELRPVI